MQTPPDDRNNAASRLLSLVGANRCAGGRPSAEGDPHVAAVPSNDSEPSDGECHKLSAEQEEAVARLVAIVAEEPHAPTAVRDPAEIARVHIADSLAALQLPVVRGARAIVDLGSGAGFPGLPLAIALPQSDVRLLESARRKSEFIGAAIARLGLANATAVRQRAEAWREGLGVHDVVLARAVGQQALVLEYAAPLLKVGGHIVDWRGKRDPGQERAAAAAAAQLGLALCTIRHTVPFAGATDRHLHVYLKVDPTPDRFPRRAGVARKRPLGRP